jgi:micrococcal nuclease
MKNISILCLLITSFLFAEDKHYGNATVAEITSIYDGDTFRCSIAGYPAIIGDRIGIRVYGVDCPEMTDKSAEVKERARQAKQYTVQRLREGKVIELVNMQRDKYFRILAVVMIDGKDLGQELISKGFAKPYFGGTK